MLFFSLIFSSELCPESYVEIKGLILSLAKVCSSFCTFERMEGEPQASEDCFDGGACST